MLKNLKLVITVVLILLITTSCSLVQKFELQNGHSGNLNNNLQKEQITLPKVRVIEKNEQNINYNEMGQIMIIMYHKFSDKETDEWTRSFENFKKDLQILYDKGYRPINLKDYINGDINVPAGCTPVIFTFDDGTSGQFNLIEQNGKLMANPKSAVGIMEEFSRNHPDFPLKGTFFINYTGFFHGKGTPKERLQYLVDKGFEIGNHTVNHANLSRLTPEGIQKELGEHVKKTQELLPGYIVDELSLPFGITSKKFLQFVEKGEFEGIQYQNRAILLVGANPALSPIDKNVNMLNLPRIRARGYKPVEGDMYYWLHYFDVNPSLRFISDGNRNIFTIPSSLKNRVNSKFNKEIVFLK